MLVDYMKSVIKLGWLQSIILFKGMELSSKMWDLPEIKISEFMWDRCSYPTNNKYTNLKQF